jgi:small-conductance mechanosensitive channel
MPNITTILRVFLLMLCSFFVASAQAVTVDRQQIEENKKIAESADNKPAVSLYEKVLAELTRSELARAEAVRYSDSIGEFVDQVAALNKQYSNSFVLSVTNPATTEEFDLLFGQIDAELLRLQQRQTQLNQTGMAINERTAQIPDELLVLNREEGNIPALVVTSDPMQDEASVQLRQSVLLRIAARREALEMERLSSKNRIELSRKELRLVETKISELESLRNIWQERLKNFNRSQFQLLSKIVADVRLQVAEGKPDANVELQEFAAQTVGLLEELEQVSVDWRAASERRQLLDKTLNQLSSEKNLFTEKLSISAASAMLGVPLMERYDNFLRTFHIDPDQLNEAHLARLHISALTSAAPLSTTVSRFTPQQQKLSQQLQDVYLQTYESTSKFYDDLILDLVRIDSLHNQLVEQAGDLRRLMRKNSLWVANAAAVNIDWLRQVVVSAVKFTGEFNKVIFNGLSDDFSAISISHIYLVVAIAAIVFRRWAKRQLQMMLLVWSKDVGSIRTDRMHETVYTLLSTIGLALFWVLPLLCLSQYFHAADQGGGYFAAVGDTFFVVARFVFAVRFLIFASLANGFFAAHLRFPETLIRSLSGPLRIAEWVGSLLVAVCLLLYRWPDPMVLGGIGRLTFLLLALFISFWIWFLVGEIQRVAAYLNMQPLFLTIIRLVLAAIPMISVLAILLGYFSLAQLLLGNAYKTLSALLFILLGFMLIRRLFSIQERRLAYERAVERRDDERERRKKAEEESNSETPIEIEEFEIDTAILRSRSMSLLQLAAVAIFILVAGQIWSEFLLAIDWLNNIALWETVKNVGNAQTVEVVSLADLLGMLIIFAVTVVLAMNLPSLIDLLVLQNMKLEPGVGFAVMTVTSYSVVVVGVLASFSAIGMDWSKMQWLVAALGVGVGFGLQEIVANLVSGLIILFERPIRLGDLITVQGESGTVSRIRMRATTIVDFDRREIVVPNKILLAEKISNWSLTDGITRVVINVGVAYGSDVELVQRLLQQAAHESSIALSEPAPEVFFNAFGNSTLDFELRVFAEEIGRRMPTRHDLHCRIIELFRAHQISIAYPQLDLHVISAKDTDDQGKL